MTDLRTELKKHKEQYQMLMRLADSSHIYRIGDDGKRTRVSLSSVVKSECESAIRFIDEALS